MKAHIISPPPSEVGGKHLALCGKKHRVKVLWDDVAPETTICRDCVDTAIMALNDAQSMISTTNDHIRVAQRALYRAHAVQFEDNVLNAATLAADSYAEAQREKATRKQRIADAQALLAEEGLLGEVLDPDADEEPPIAHDHAAHEHVWQDTGFATVEDCAVEGCCATRAAAGGAP